MSGYDFSLYLDTDELIEDVGEPDIKVLLINSMTWMTAYCQNPRLFQENNLYNETIELIEYFDRLLQKEGEDIHSFFEATLIRCDSLSTVVRFRGMKDD